LQLSNLTVITLLSFITCFRCAIAYGQKYDQIENLLYYFLGLSFFSFRNKKISVIFSLLHFQRKGEKVPFAKSVDESPHFRTVSASRCREFLPIFPTKKSEKRECCCPERNSLEREFPPNFARKEGMFFLLRQKLAVEYSNITSCCIAVYGEKLALERISNNFFREKE